MDRINVNGVWYVPEKQPTDNMRDSFVLSSSILYESDDFKIEFTTLLKEYGKRWRNTSSISVISKTERISHFIDNLDFIKAYQRREPSYQEKIIKSIGEKRNRILIEVVDQAHELGWLD